MSADLCLSIPNRVRNRFLKCFHTKYWGSVLFIIDRYRLLTSPKKKKIGFQRFLPFALEIPYLFTRVSLWKESAKFVLKKRILFAFAAWFNRSFQRHQILAYDLLNVTSQAFQKPLVKLAGLPKPPLFFSPQRTELIGKKKKWNSPIKANSQCQEGCYNRRSASGYQSWQSIHPYKQKEMNSGQL